jgi:hypothetical protein
MSKFAYRQQGIKKLLVSCLNPVATRLYYSLLVLSKEVASDYTCAKYSSETNKIVQELVAPYVVC